jgi:hypothetical protein
MTRKGRMVIVALATLLVASACLASMPFVHAACKGGPCGEPEPPPPPPPSGGSWIVEPRYKIEALGFRCHSETGADRLGSDEVIVVIDICPDDVHCVTTYSRIFGNVDSGDSELFESDESCILPIDGVSGQSDTVRFHPHPWTCADAGVPGPFGFIVSMYEVDDLSWSNSDDLIGQRTILFTAEELAAAMPNVNDTVDRNIQLGCPDGGICAGYPNYLFTYRLTRLPDAILGPIEGAPVESLP